MNFFKFSSKKIFLALLFFVQLGFCEICLAVDNEDLDVKKKISLHDLIDSVLFKQILDKDFSSEQDKLLASSLRCELLAKYELISASIQKDKSVANSGIDVLNLLIEWQKVAQTKLEVIRTFNLFILDEYQIRSIKLHILEKFYIVIQKFWDQIISDKIKLQQFKDSLKDTFVIDIMKSASGLFKYCLNSEMTKFLKIDFVNFGKDWYSKYQNLIEQYRKNQNDLVVLDKTFLDEVDEVLIKLIAQKNDLLKSNDVLKVKSCGESIKQFFGFGDNTQELMIKFVQNLIFQLLKIKDEIIQAKLLFESFSKLSSSKKEIMFKHMILSDDRDVKVGAFSAYFERYKNLVEEFLYNDKMPENFLFRLECCLYDLRKFKNSKEAKGSLYSLGVLKDSGAIKDCFLIEQMISILENITKTLKAEKEGISGKGVFEQLVNGDIKIPEKFKNFAVTFVQGLLNG